MNFDTNLIQRFTAIKGAFVTNEYFLDSITSQIHEVIKIFAGILRDCYCKASKSRKIDTPFSEF